jgi:hypothetical protein
MAQRKVESGRSRRICKARLEQMVLMEKMEVKERLFQLHQLLQVPLVLKVYKERKVRRGIKVMLVHQVQPDLPDQLVSQVRQDRKVHQEVEVEVHLELQELRARQVQQEQRG